MATNPLDSDYFRRRADEERAAAARARDPRVRQSHQDLAQRYLDAMRNGVPRAGDDYDQRRAVIGPEFRIIE